MITESLNRLNYILDTVPDLLYAIPENEFSAKPSLEKWSKKEILGHLIDSAVNNHCRFIRSLYEDIPHIVYDQNAWNRLNHYQELAGKRIIEFWTLYNRHILFVMQHVNEEALTRLCNSGGKEPYTLRFLFDDYIVHMEHHLKQILDY